MWPLTNDFTLVAIEEYNTTTTYNRSHLTGLLRGQLTGVRGENGTKSRVYGFFRDNLFVGTIRLEEVEFNADVLEDGRYALFVMPRAPSAHLRAAQRQDTDE